MPHKHQDLQAYLHTMARIPAPSSAYLMSRDAVQPPLSQLARPYRVVLYCRMAQHNVVEITVSVWSMDAENGCSSADKHHLHASEFQSNFLDHAAL